jgi:ribosomal-protein-alanine N-acetyltransferase
MILNTTNPDIILRSYHAQDAEALVAIANNRKIWLNLRDVFPHPYHLEDAQRFIKMCTESEPHAVLGIEYQGILAGSIGLHLQVDVYRLSAELGYFVGEPFWNKAIASEAVKRMLQYGFETLHLHRIYASVYAHNKASMHVLEKNGFTLEGVKKQAVYKNESFTDEYFYGILNE